MSTAIQFPGHIGGPEADRAFFYHYKGLRSASKGRLIMGFPFKMLYFGLYVDGEIASYGRSGAGRIRFGRNGTYITVEIGVTQDDWSRVGPEGLTAFISGALMSSVDLLKKTRSSRLAGADFGALEAALRALCGAYETYMASLPEQQPEGPATPSHAESALATIADFNRGVLVPRVAPPAVRGSQAFVNACSTGNIPKLKTLLREGADPNALDQYRLTVLIWTGRKGRVEAAKLLLAHGADLEGIDSTGRTALFHAVTYRRYEYVEYLVSVAANVNTVDLGGWTPLDFSTANGDRRMALLLERLGGRRAATKDYPLL